MNRFIRKPRTGGAALGSLALLLSSIVLADDAPGTAVELLAAFTGESATKYAPLFRMSDGSEIVSVEIHAAGMANTTARYSGQEDVWYEVNNILRLTTADGLEAVSGVDTYYQGGFKDQHLRELQRVANWLFNLQTLDPVAVSSQLRRNQPDLSDSALASVDIALWDLAARKAKRPLHALLGARRKSIDSYASLPFYDSLSGHIDAVRKYARLGFTKFKFHVWGSLEEDLALVKAIQQTFAESNYRFMIDLESVYDFGDALALGRQMEKGLFLWFEAPISDELLNDYAKLTCLLDLPIVPAGYNVYSADFLQRGIALDAWDAGRFDTTVVGGISAALNLLIIANAADLPVDVQSWGHSLGQAVNLHLMLANRRTQYFEAPMPQQVFEFGMKNGKLIVDGVAVSPAGPGLGVEADWNRLPAADFYRYVSVNVADQAATIAPRSSW